MSEAKKKCQLEGCSRAASTRCFCCNKDVCTRHFSEHIDAVKAQIDPLANEINTTVEKIQSLTIEQITDSSFAELQQWRSDMHELIDEIFLVKSKEMEDLTETNKQKFVEHKKQQLEAIMKIQDDVKQLVEDGDATFEQIQSLKNQLSSVETKINTFRKEFVSLNTRVFAQGLVTVSSNLNKPPPPPPAENLQSNSINAQINSGFGSSTASCNSPRIFTMPAGQPKATHNILPTFYGPTSTSCSTTTSPAFAFGSAPTTTTSATSIFSSGSVPTTTTSATSIFSSGSVPTTTTSATSIFSSGSVPTTTTPATSMFAFGSIPVTVPSVSAVQRTTPAIFTFSSGSIPATVSSVSVVQPTAAPMYGTSPFQFNAPSFTLHKK